MPLVRVYSYCKLLAFWLVGYGEWLWRLMRTACRVLVVGWGFELVCSCEQEWNNSPSLINLYSPTTPHFPPLWQWLCIYANPLTKTFVGDYQQVTGESKKLSPKNLHMSNPNITFTPSII
jgi:hypothetical protein